MEADTTVIYYTSNQEDEAFEQKIREKLLEVIGDLPLISVSQKPINLGKNICVGEVGVSNQNAHRQLQVGCEAATTKYIHIAEADCLYSKEYFEYRPPVDNRAFRTPIYVHYLKGDRFHKKRASECATVVGREYLIYRIKRSLRNRPMWEPTLVHGASVPFTFRHEDWEQFDLSVPPISLKTGKGMHQTHGYVGTETELPYWGKASDITKLFT
jgi:hypothetical protein